MLEWPISEYSYFSSSYEIVPCPFSHFSPFIRDTSSQEVQVHMHLSVRLIVLLEVLRSSINMELPVILPRYYTAYLVVHGKYRYVVLITNNLKTFNSIISLYALNFKFLMGWNILRLFLLNL